MIKDVIITIKTEQRLDEDSDTLEFTTSGRYGFKDGCYFISYDESEIIGAADVKTYLYLKSDNYIVLKRMGALKSSMIIEQGKRNCCIYNTVQGEMLIGIFGEDIKYNLSDSGGDVLMKYTIDSNLNLISRNTVNISVREVKK